MSSVVLKVLVLGRRVLAEISSTPRPVNFALLCVLSAALLWRPLIATFSLALHSDQYTHIILILPISAALICSEWNHVRPRPNPDAGAGKLLFVCGICIAAMDRWSVWLSPDVRLSVGMLALIILWISAFLICFGSGIARSVLFPLGFLFWMVPIPSFALVRIVQGLQQGSAFAAWLLFAASGVPALRDGVLVSIPGLTVEVARECSSIRSSLMLLVTTMVLAHVLLKTFWRKALIILLAVPLSVAKNGLRIFTIAMLGIRVDRGFLTGHLHHDGGIVFFSLALAAIALLMRLLRRGERTIVSVPTLTPLTAGDVS